MFGHYVLRSQINHPEEILDILDSNQATEADEEMRANLRAQFKNFIQHYKEYGIRLIDNEQVLGDISDLVS